MTTEWKLKLRSAGNFAALMVTCVAWLMINIELISDAWNLVAQSLDFRVVPYPITRSLIELALFGFIINFLLYGGVVFILTRQGYLRRLSKHQPAGHEELARIYDQDSPPTLTVLVPSYKEEPQVVLRTLLSAALLDYPRRRVVLLIDDPPQPILPQDRELLSAARQLPVDVTELLQPEAQKVKHEGELFETRALTGFLDIESELLHLANLYHEAALWFEEQAQKYAIDNHEARFFVEEILGRPARVHRQHAREMLTLILEERSVDDEEGLRCEYRRLAGLFDVEMASFERKQFTNLSHEANKAMNLNSYIGLIGGDWKIVQHGTRASLHEVEPGTGNLHVPDSDYIITLDADSLLMHDYALRLMHEMERPGSERLAIVQTPYSAFPGATASLETIAGAQTDMQYIVHQGFTQHQATFWVGANALLRKKALDDIVIEDIENGHVIKRYIQDRTVIEDTESSIDLVEKEWELFNYPERLAYSATPPDFGSLLIQRRRWANGGLIIFPKMVRHVLRGPGRLRKLPEGFLRSHYLISTAMTNLGLLIMILFGLDSGLVSPWLILSVAVYFMVYALSLKEAGYRRRDLFRVWALNLLLIPVNLAGALKSMQQAITRKRVPFGRTPKVERRTASPAWLMLVEVGLVVYCLASAVFDLIDHNWLNSGFAALNGFIFFYGVAIFIGWRDAFEDIKLGIPRPKRRRKSATYPSASQSGD